MGVEVCLIPAVTMTHKQQVLTGFKFSVFQVSSGFKFPVIFRKNNCPSENLTGCRISEERH